MTCAMPVNRSRRSRKAATATSLAALRTTGSARPSASARTARPRQGNRPGSGGRKSSRPSCARSSGANRRIPPFGIGERVLDRQPHVRHASCAMTDPSTSSTIECTIDCGMHDDVDAVGRNVEEPAGLDDLEPLVHQRRGVDRDLLTHLPGRVLQRGIGGHARQIVAPGDRETVRPTPSGPAAAPPRTAARAGTGGSRCARCRPEGW